MSSPHQEESTSSDLFSQEAIRKALRAWESTRSLSEHPLAQARTVQEHRLAAGYSDTPAGHGLALRETLMAAIEAIRPESGPPDPAEKRWRPYLILYEQYIREKSRECVIDELHISRRTYYNEQEEGMKTVGDVLSEWEMQADRQKAISLPTAISPAGEHHVPFLAPPRPAHALIGREDVIDELKSRLLAPAALPTIALHGLPGVGKTSLAIQLAHDADIRARYHDGILWAGLGRQPDIPTLLAGWGAALQIPAEAMERCTSNREYAQAIHAAIGTRHILLIIDDAWQIESALAFRLGGPNCACLLTTRLSHLALDFAADGLIAARELDDEHGVHLLAEFAPQAVSTDPAGASALVDAVGGLPLALVLMGRHLRQHSLGSSMRRLQSALQTLQESRARLQLSQPVSPVEQRSDLPDDATLSLQGIIGLSEAALDDAGRQTLYCLAVFPPKPNTFSEEAALAVSQVGAEALDMLLDHGLIECTSETRYTLHQTIADYAVLQRDDPAARQRFVDYFTTINRENCDLQALELNNQLHALELAYQAGMASHLFDSLQALQDSLARRGLYATAEHHLQHAVIAAHREGDENALAWSLCYLGYMVLRQSRYTQAEGHLQEALALAERLGLTKARAKCLHGLGEIHFHLSDYATSHRFHEQALVLFEQSHNLAGKGDALVGIGHALLHQESYDNAAGVYQQAIDIYQQIGEQEGKARAINGLGLIAWNRGDYAGAQVLFEQCHQVCRQSGCRRSDAVALHNLGLVYDDLCDYIEARNCFQKALSMFRAAHDRRNEGRALGSLGLFSHHLGDQEAAREYSFQAKNIAIEVGDRAGSAYAFTYLGHALEASGECEQAIEAYQQALAMWRELKHEDQMYDAAGGLANTYHAQGNLAAARAQVALILDYEHRRQNLVALDEPLRVYETCYRVLLASGEETLAQSLLERAYTLLAELAKQVTDPDRRRIMIENGPGYRDIWQEYRKRFGDSAEAPAPKQTEITT
ncbi:MAG: tetratricopeptide repeat protein [Chloroflexota bacterium]